MSKVDSTLLGIIIGAIGTYLTLRYNYKALFAKTVSESRNRWIDIFRENISIMLAETESYIRLREMCLCFGSNTALKDGHYNSFCKARNMIISRLNENEDDHIMLQSSIMQLNIDQINMLKFAKMRELILIQTRFILKPEWERVKEEANGEK